MEQPSNLKEVFHVAGNAPDPEGGDLRGLSVGHNFSNAALGHPQLHYRLGDGREIILEADVYHDHVHIICPICHEAGRTVGLRIRVDQKDYEYNPLVEPPMWPGWVADQRRIAFPRGVGGTFSCAPFRCTWEAAPDLTRGFGLQRCPWSVSVTKNLVRNR